jgi:hypothetical protein
MLAHGQQDRLLYSALHGTAWRHAAEQHKSGDRRRGYVRLQRE